MTPILLNLFNEHLPDHQRLGVTDSPSPAEVREAVARIRRALLHPQLSEEQRLTGTSFLAVVAPRLHGGPLPPIHAAPPSVPVAPARVSAASSTLHLTVFDRQLLAYLSRGGFRGNGRRKILALARRHGVGPEQLGTIMLGLAQWTRQGRGQGRPLDRSPTPGAGDALPFDRQGTLRLAIALTIFLLISIGVLVVRWPREGSLSAPTPVVAIIESVPDSSLGPPDLSPSQSKVLRWERTPGLVARAWPDGARTAASGLRAIRTSLRSAATQTQLLERTKLIEFVDQLGLAWLVISPSEQDAVVREMLAVLLALSQEDPADFGGLVRSLAPSRAPSPELPTARARLEILVELERSMQLPSELRPTVREAVNRALGVSAKNPLNQPRTEWLIREGKRLVSAMNNQRDRSVSASRWMAMLPDPEAKRVAVVIEVLGELLRTTRVIEGQSPNGLMDYLASLLSAIPESHPNLRELVVEIHRNPAVRSGTVWALGSWLASERWGGFFDARLVLDHLGLVGPDRQASRERLARRISEAWPTQWAPAEEERAFWANFVATWRSRRDQVVGDGSEGVTRAGRLAYLNNVGLEALLGNLGDARRRLDKGMPSALLQEANPIPVRAQADDQLLSRLRASSTRSARRKTLEEAESVIASPELATELIRLVLDGHPTERRAVEGYLHREMTSDPAVLVAISDAGLDLSDRFLAPFFDGDFPSGRETRAARLLVRAAISGLPQRTSAFVALADAWSPEIQDPLPALDALLLRVPNINPPSLSPRTVAELLDRRRTGLQGIADHAVRRGWLDPWDVKAVFRDRAIRRQTLRHPEAILADLEWTESEILDRALAVRRDGRRIDRTKVEALIDMPMEVPAGYVTALEQLRPERPESYFELAEVALASGESSLARWLSGLAARLDPTGFSISTALLYAASSGSSSEKERYERLAMALGAAGLSEQASGSLSLAEEIRLNRKVNNIPAEVLQFLAVEPTDPYDPALLVFEAWCRAGDRVVDPLLAFQAGLQPPSEVFPNRLELEFSGEPSQPWFRRGRWTHSPLLGSGNP